MDKILLINKKENITSYDVIKAVKRIFHTKKVGHCGTLDPFASGLLIVGVNQATKIMPYLETSFKEYIAEIKFGSKTDTLDLTGNVIKTSKVCKCSDDKINQVLNKFLGEITQVPPIYSAIQVNGRHLYEYARNNEDVDIPKRNVFIYDLKLLENNMDSIKIYVKCSKGTYIRTLGEDIANALNNDGHLISLIRTKIGNLSLDMATSYDDLINNNFKAYDIKDVLDFKQINDLSNNKLIRVYNGQNITLINENAKNVLIMDDNKGIAVYNLINDNNYHCERGLFNEDIRFKRIRELQGK
ncbi:MAG: tRNA pseudouridine(55) synthase TruB [Candidatus Caccosoma sp.]|nr:tRNA pseudouridine(55) synthase TruB [Candidatus Caccosoma sp.]